MTPEQITADVDRGLAISEQIKDLQWELKIIEKRLTQAALEGVTEPLQDQDREGRQFIAAGSTAKLPVIIESDQIIASYAPETEISKALNTLCGAERENLYRACTKYERVPKDGKAFRDAAFAHFGADLGAKIISASIQRDKNGIPRSRIIIPWDRAKS